MYYATTDSRGERILEYAEIVEYWTLAEARDHLLDSFSEVEKGFEIEIVAGHFDDFWKELESRPNHADTIISPFLWSEVNIEGPDENPRRRHYRITPIPTVLIAKLVRARLLRRRKS